MKKLCDTLVCSTDDIKLTYLYNVVLVGLIDNVIYWLTTLIVYLCYIDVVLANVMLWLAALITKFSISVKCSTGTGYMIHC